MTKAVAEGLPKHRIEEAAAARAAKVDTGETVIVGVNRYRLAEEEEHDILEVDNAKVRAARSRGSRRCAQRATRARSGPRWTRWKTARGATRNLLELSGRRRRASALRSARFRTRWSGRSGAITRRPSRCAASTARRATTARWRAAEGGTQCGRRSPRPQAAHPGRQDGPGRPRPRRESRVVRVRRSRVRGDPRAAVPDPARDRANGGRE